MKIVGLIAEYNPFHNGHQYHIEKAKEVTGADYAVVVMSGDYVQRGAPAIMPKRLRARMALEGGAAAVWELPVCYATGSAELFAFGAVSLLEQLGAVDALCFGSECGDLSPLEMLADLLLKEPPAYRIHLKQSLKNGCSFPAARQKALTACLPSETPSSLLQDPNNILGTEYLKALRRLNSRIVPYTIQRKGAPYHRQELTSSYSSASAIRTLLTGSPNEEELSSGLRRELSGQIPESALALLLTQYGTTCPIQEKDFSFLLKYRLLQESADSLPAYADVSAELANRIQRQLRHFINYPQFCSLLKTKELTQTRISRSLLHILLEIKKDALLEYLKQGPHFYAHLLGFRKDCEEILPVLAKKSNIPFLTTHAEQEKLSASGKNMLQQDMFASDLYASAVTEKFQTTFQSEARQPLLKV